MASPPEPAFPRLVGLACHDLRTPLATVHGFARTLLRMDDVPDTLARYLGIMEAASGQLAALLDDLALAARIESGRWEPAVEPVDSLELVRRAAAVEGPAEVTTAGEGAAVAVDADATVGALAAFASCAARHGGEPRLELRADGGVVRLSPVPPAAEPVILAESLRDFGCAVALMVVAALGGSVEVEEEALVVRLPLAGPS